MESLQKGKPNQEDLLQMQLVERLAEFEKKLEKSDPKGTDPNRFNLYTIRMASVELTTPDKDQTKTKLKVIRDEKEKILSRDWTPESTAQMVLLNKDQNLLENPGIDLDMANSKAHLEEAKRLEHEAKNLSQGAYVTKDNIVISDQQRAFSRYLQSQAKFLEIQASQKTIANPRQTLLNKIKNLIM